MINLKRIKRYQSRSVPDNCIHISDSKTKTKSTRNDSDVQLTIEQLRNAPALDKLSIIDGVFQNMISQCAEYTDFIGDYAELVSYLCITDHIDFTDPDTLSEFLDITDQDPKLYFDNFIDLLKELCDRVKPTYFSTHNLATRLNYFTFVKQVTDVGYNLILCTGETLALVTSTTVDFNKAIFRSVNKAITLALNGLRAIKDVNTLFSAGKIPNVSDIAAILGNRAQSLANDIHDLFINISDLLSKVTVGTQVIINNYINVVLDWFTNLYETLRDHVTEDAFGISFSDPRWKMCMSISIPWGTVISTVGTIVSSIVTCVWPVVGFALNAVTNIIPGIANWFSQKVDDTTRVGISNVNFDAYGYNVPYNQMIISNGGAESEAFSWFDSMLQSRSVNYCKLTTEGRISYIWYANSNHDKIKIETYVDMSFNPILSIWFSIYTDILNSDLDSTYLTTWKQFLFGQNYNPSSILDIDSKCSMYDIIDYETSLALPVINSVLSDDTKRKISNFAKYFYSSIVFPDAENPNVTWDPNVAGVEVCKHWYSIASCNREVSYYSFAYLLNHHYQDYVVTGDQLQALHEIYDEYDGVVSEDYDEQIRKDWCINQLPCALFFNWHNMINTQDFMQIFTVKDLDDIHSLPDHLHNSLYEKLSFKQRYDILDQPLAATWVQYTIDSPHRTSGYSVVQQALTVIDAFLSNIILIKFSDKYCTSVIDDFQLSPAGFNFIAKSALDGEGSILTDYLDFRNSHKYPNNQGTSQTYVLDMLSYYPLINIFDIEVPNTSIVPDYINLVTYNLHNSGFIVVMGSKWNQNTGSMQYDSLWRGAISSTIYGDWTDIHDYGVYQELNNSYFYGWDVLCDPEDGIWCPIPLSQEEASIESSGYISFLLCGKGDQYYTLPRMSIKAWIKLAILTGVIAGAATIAIVAATVIRKKIKRAAQRTSLQTDIIGFSDDLLSSDPTVRNKAFKKYRRSALKASILNSLAGNSIEADTAEQSVYVEGTNLTSVYNKLDYITTVIDNKLLD